MRSLVLLLGLAGCNLYVGDDDGSSDDGVPPPVDGPFLIGCQGGPVDPPDTPGAVGFASRLATAGNELAWDVARSPTGAIFVAGELEGGAQGLLACFEPQGALGWSELDGTVARWRGVTVLGDGAPVAIGELHSGGSVVRRLQFANDPQPPWSVSFSGPAGAVSLNAIAQRDGIRLIVVGDLSGELVIGSQTVASAGGTDGIVIEMDFNGSVTGTMQFGGTGDDRAVAIDVGPGGTAIAGETRSASLEVGGQTLTGGGGLDALVFQRDSLGAVTWARRVGGSGDDVGVDVAVDDQDRVYLAAEIEGAPVVIAHDETGLDRWSSYLRSNIAHLWAIAAGAGHDGVYLAGMYFQPASFAGDALPGDSTAPRFVAQVSADTGLLGWIVAGEGPTLDGALDLGASLLMAGPYLVNFDMGGVRLEPSTPHDIYVMELAP